jgi:hypothetical protein
MAEIPNAFNIMRRCRANVYYRRAIDSEDYRDAVALREAALKQQLALPAVQRPDEPTTPDADLGVWLDATVEAEAAERARATRHSALTALMNACNRRIEAAVIYPDRMLSTLHAELAALMTDVGAVAQRLNGASTPREVIASGTGDVWRELDPLRSEYDKLRQAQEWAMLGRDELQNARSKHVDDPHASDAWIANLDTVFPGWRDPDRTFRLTGDAPRRQPWPADETEMLVWLHESDARPWIPRLDQLAELNAARRRRLNPPPKHNRVDPGWTIPGDAVDKDTSHTAADEAR